LHEGKHKVLSTKTRSEPRNSPSVTSKRYLPSQHTIISKDLTKQPHVLLLQGDPLRVDRQQIRAYFRVSHIIGLLGRENTTYFQDRPQGKPQQPLEERQEHLVGTGHQLEALQLWT